MSIQDIIAWLEGQSQHAQTEFKNGVEHYRWGEDVPTVGEFSTAFELGWMFARLQHSN